MYCFFQYINKILTVTSFAKHKQVKGVYRSIKFNEPNLTFNALKDLYTLSSDLNILEFVLA